MAIPPELRRFLAAWCHLRAGTVRGRAAPLFPGNSHGRVSQPAVRRALATLDAPASLWEDAPEAGIGDGDSADGRALLHHLTPWNLWLRRHRQREQIEPA